MAYYIRAGLVEENKQLLEKILQAITSNEEFIVRCHSVTEVSRTRNWINKMLRACRDLPDECNGRYSHLRSMVVVSDDLGYPAVRVKPKAGPIQPSQIVTRTLNPDEHSALELLESSKSEAIVPLDFTPSDDYPGDEWFRTQVAKKGYELQIYEVEPELGGGVTYIAKRSTDKPASPFDLLKKHGYTG